MWSIRNFQWTLVNTENPVLYLITCMIEAGEEHGAGVQQRFSVQLVPQGQQDGWQEGQVR